MSPVHRCPRLPGRIFFPPDGRIVGRGIGYGHRLSWVMSGNRMCRRATLGTTPSQDGDGRFGAYATEPPLHVAAVHGALVAPPAAPGFSWWSFVRTQGSATASRRIRRERGGHASVRRDSTVLNRHSDPGAPGTG